MLFIRKETKTKINNDLQCNESFESFSQESLLGCAGCASIYVWLGCDLVVMCVQAVSDRAFGDLCVCVWCGFVQSQLV